MPRQYFYILTLRHYTVCNTVLKVMNRGENLIVEELLRFKACSVYHITKPHVISRRFQAYVFEHRNFEGCTKLSGKLKQSRNLSESKL
jgi:hypothetical protein